LNYVIWTAAAAFAFRKRTACSGNEQRGLAGWREILVRPPAGVEQRLLRNHVSQRLS